jgi:hypothetical protein
MFVRGLLGQGGRAPFSARGGRGGPGPVTVALSGAGEVGLQPRGQLRLGYGADSAIDL